MIERGGRAGPATPPVYTQAGPCLMASGVSFTVLSALKLIFLIQPHNFGPQGLIAHQCREHASAGTLQFVQFHANFSNTR